MFLSILRKECGVKFSFAYSIIRWLHFLQIKCSGCIGKFVKNVKANSALKLRETRRKPMKEAGNHREAKPKLIFSIMTQGCKQPAIFTELWLLLTTLIQRKWRSDAWTYAYEAVSMWILRIFIYFISLSNRCIYF